MSKHHPPTTPADTPDSRLEEIVAQLRAVHEYAAYRFTESQYKEADAIMVALSDRELVSLLWHTNAHIGVALTAGMKQLSKWDSHGLLVIMANIDEIQFWEDVTFLVSCEIDRRMELPEPNEILEAAGFGAAPEIRREMSKANTAARVPRRAAKERTRPGAIGANPFPQGSLKWFLWMLMAEDEEAKQPLRLMFLSFADPTGIGGFLGAVVIEAHGPLTACSKAHNLKINPGGEIASWDLLPKDYPPVEAWNRLLTADEVKQYFPDSKSLRELDAEGSGVPGD